MRGVLILLCACATACSDAPPKRGGPGGMPGLGGAGGAAGVGGAGDAGVAGASDVPPRRPDPVGAYRTIEDVYAGPAGIYRGCGPNGGVCHNGREYPDLRTLGAVLEHIDKPCNQKRDAPREVHDLCERAGDLLRSDEASSELGFVEPVDAQEEVPRRYRIRVRDPLRGDVAAAIWRITRPVAGQEVELWSLSAAGAQVVLDPADASGQSLLVQLPPAPVPSDMDPEPYDMGAEYSRALAGAGQHADPTAIQLGDPNRNGTFGASLGGRLIKPGQPAQSYLLKRLTDPGAGPLMPRANCCYWTKDSLRAIYCWIAGLRPDASNALDPIDYAACPDGPLERVRYPEPGPQCETSGLCPVEAEGVALPDQPTFDNLYRNVFLQSCSGTFCHVDRGVANLDMRSAETAYRDLRARVVPGDPMGSRLYQRIEPSLCLAPACSTMPLDRPVLAAEARDLVARWIQLGAMR